MTQPSGALDFAPVAIGGVGGSGTRLVANTLLAAGYDLGSRRNAAQDNLWFTFLFRRPDWFQTFPSPEDIAVAFHAFTRATGTGAAWNADSHDTALASEILATHDAAFGPRPVWLKDDFVPEFLAPRPAQESELWGWKEPNTHIFLPWIAPLVPGLKYIHVIRSGLDMAYSVNQNQVRNWGQFLLGTAGEVTLRRSLDFWIAANRRVIDFASGWLGDRFLLLNYDALCADPAPHLEALSRFLGAESNLALRTSQIRPRGIGQHLRHDRSVFTGRQLAAVAELMQPLGGRAGK